MEIVYIPGTALDFKTFIDARYADDTIELRGVDGKNRWVIRREDGTEYIARPISAKPTNE